MQTFESRCRIALTLGGLLVAWASPSRAENVDFDKQIRPILTDRCIACHGPAKRKGGLRLDNRSDALDGSPDAIIPGKGSESQLVERITAADPEDRMPPAAEGKPLTAEQVALLRRWVDEGAIWPEPKADPNTASLDNLVSAEERAFWSFQPIAKLDPPELERDSWSRTPIDGFVLAKLRASGLSPAPTADKRDLIRRATFDLWGLPPTPEEVEVFVRDRAPQAYEKLVDRLLASPNYGERWASHWLDVVRYAETEGFEYDNAVPDVWRYRDYVIQALNEDTPYDRFVSEQIAGDETDPGNARLRIAGGFYRIGVVRRNAGNQEIAASRNEVLTERTDVIGAAFLGLTMGCARCHDHKFDPIRQKDYYQLQAFLAATQFKDAPMAGREDEYVSWKKEVEPLMKDLGKLEKDLMGAVGADAEQLRARIHELEKKVRPAPPLIATVMDGEETPIHVLKRGDPEKKLQQVPMNPPVVLDFRDKAQPLPPGTPNPRAALAHWLVDKRHPLTARVMANRMWQYHFGRGLVTTANDFGANGTRPSHPELLDYLAGRLVAGGWRLKPLHKMILMSAVYQQASRSPLDKVARDKDPENNLLWKFSRRRLAAEEIRDAMLKASGQLNDKRGGPGVMLPVEKELVVQLYKPTQWQVTKDPTEHRRRSVYLFAKRNLRLPFMEVFDQPGAQSSCGARQSSTHAPQALELLNGTIANDLARAFALRLKREARTPATQVERAYHLTTGRAPNAVEKREALAFLKTQPLDELALAMFNLNGFLYVN